MDANREKQSEVKQVARLGTTKQYPDNTASGVPIKYFREKPEVGFIVNSQYRFVFCPIRKNASTSMLGWCLRLIGIEMKDRTDMKHLTFLKDCSHQEALQILNSDDYFKFVVVRNPLARLVSGYTHWVVGKVPEYAKDIHEMITRIYVSRGLAPDYVRSITFQEFVEYLHEHGDDDDSVNAHFKSQSWYMGSKTKFDFVVRLEYMPE